MPKLFRPWTSEDVEIALKMSAAGKRNIFIANKLGRTQSAVKTMMYKVRKEQSPNAQ